MSDSRPAPAQGPDTGGRRRPIRLLLLVPLLLVLAPPLYNRVEPELFGIPFFYWYQLAVIPVGVLCTVAVYRAEREDRAVQR